MHLFNVCIKLNVFRYTLMFACMMRVCQNKNHNIYRNFSLLLWFGFILLCSVALLMWTNSIAVRKIHKRARRNMKYRKAKDLM